MDYKLAKQLKEAGFDQDLEGGTWECVICQEALKEKKISVCEDFHDDFVYIPTLTELIDACGEGFWELGRAAGAKPEYRFWADGQFDKTHGKTADEAVAKLYIKLNEATKERQG